MRRIPNSLIFLLWVVVHFLLASGVVLILVDRMELINQLVMPEECDAYLKFRPSAVVYSEWTFARRCWDIGNALDFFAFALVGVSIILSPITLTLLVRFRSSRTR